MKEFLFGILVGALLGTLILVYSPQYQTYKSYYIINHKTN